MPALVLSPAAKWLIGLLLVLAMCGACFHYGIEWQEGVQAKEDLKEADDARQRMLARMKDDRDAQAKLAADLKKEREGRNQDQQDFDRKLANAPRETIFENSCGQQDNSNRSAAGRTEPASTAQAAQGIPEPASSSEASAKGSPDPGVRLSTSGCGLWNSAVLAGYTIGERGQLPPDADACAGPVEPKDAIRNLRSASELLGECRLREQKTQAFLRRKFGIAQVVAMTKLAACEAVFLKEE